LPYILITGALGLIAVVIVVIRALLQARSGESSGGDYVAQNVLTRINAEYPERH
jgi:hypothetical protein